MSMWPTSVAILRRTLAATFSMALVAGLAHAQRNDDEYTKKIKENLRDPRITTELVDHLPYSATVPSPLKFHGRIIGQPGELTYAKQSGRAQRGDALAR